MIKSQKKKELPENNSEKGQAFIEFVFLMAVIMLLSLVFLKIGNNGLATRWKAIVELVAYPEKVEFR